jgi:hypothetical protein
LAHSLFGQILGVRKFVNQDIEVDFYHEDTTTTYRYSSDSSRLSNFPKDLIETMASTLAKDVCVEIFFDNDGNPTHIELEECDDGDDDFEDDEDSDDDEDYIEDD